MNDAYEKAAAALRRARRAIAVTGAGVSAESGIPTFRGAGGIWTKYPPEQYATLSAFLDHPADFWQFWHELQDSVGGVQPNPAHAALAALEQMGRLQAVITQNIDNLHQNAGSRRVIEYHGNARYVVCLDCGRRAEYSLDLRETTPPHCVCRGLIKPDVVLFGEMLSPDALVESDALANRADVVIIVGTSAQVYPAAAIPVTAKRAGAFVIEANIEPTDFTRSITDAFLEGPAGETLPKLVEMVKGEES